MYPRYSSGRLLATDVDICLTAESGLSGMQAQCLATSTTIKINNETYLFLINAKQYLQLCTMGLGNVKANINIYLTLAKNSTVV